MENGLMHRARSFLNRPTLWAQATTAFGALVLVTLLTRSLTADDYAIYAAVMATYAFGNALVATTIGTRAIEAISRHQQERLVLLATRDLSALILCTIAAGVTALVLSANGGIVAWAMLGMCGMLITELTYSYALGHGRYRTFLSLTAIRTALWVGGTIVLVILVPQAYKLDVALASSFLGAIPMLLFLIAERGIGVTMGAAANARELISSVGVANLSLWLLASADRVLLAHFALSEAATYAAIYGILDRGYRSVANADLQIRLPKAFAGTQDDSTVVWKRGGLALLLASAVAAAVLSPTAVGLISGNRYRPSMALSIPLCLGMSAMLAAVPSFVTLIASGRAREAAQVAVFAAAVNVIGNLVLIPVVGSEGAAFLTLAGYLIWLGGLLYAVHRPMRYGKTVPPMAPDEAALSAELAEVEGEA